MTTEAQPQYVEDMVQRHHYDKLTGASVIETIQDLAPYIAANKRMYDENQINKSSSSWRKDTTMGWHKASIPNLILHKWMMEFKNMTGAATPPTLHNEEFKKFMARKLRDPEYRYLRVDGRKD